MDDTWAKEIAKNLKLEKVEDLDGLKKLIKDSLQAQKEHILLHEYQDKVLEEAVKISNISIPQPAIEYEALEREKTFINEIGQRGIDLKDFMKAQNLSIEKMREMWTKDAKDALETDALLNLFAKEKGIKVTDEELEKKVEEIKKGQGEQNNEVYSNPQWREYIRNIERKQKAFQVLMDDVLGKEEKRK